MKSFQELLEFGKSYERETLKYLMYDSYEFSVGAFKEWDLKITKDNVDTYYEVKSELNCFKYGNILVEYSKLDNSKSCITATTADFWVHYAIKDKAKNIYDICIIPVKDLKKMIEDKLYHRVVKCGSGNGALCYLFKMSLFDKYLIPSKI